MGLTYTTGFKLSLNAEAEYSSGAPNAAQWNALPRNARQQLLSTSLALQDLPARQQWFFSSTWKDLLVQRLDVSGFLRHDMETHSRAFWLEGRYSWERAEVAPQWQVFTGPPGSVYYAAPPQQTLQVVLRLYL